MTRITTAHQFWPPKLTIVVEIEREREQETVEPEPIDTEGVELFGPGIAKARHSERPPLKLVVGGLR